MVPNILANAGDISRIITSGKLRSLGENVRKALDVSRMLFQLNVLPALDEPVAHRTLLTTLRCADELRLTVLLPERAGFIYYVDIFNELCYYGGESGRRTEVSLSGKSSSAQGVENAKIIVTSIEVKGKSAYTRYKSLENCPVNHRVLVEEIVLRRQNLEDLIANRMLGPHFFTLLLAVLCLGMTTFGLLREDCAAHGYNVAVLSCDTCEQIRKVVDHAKTYENCKSCCIEKAEETYELAVLEVDKRYVAFMKEISSVIEDKAKLKLKVRYRSVSPTLRMYKVKGDSEPAESIAVGSWEKKTFEDYLSTHLAAGSTSDKAKKADAKKPSKSTA